MKVEAVDVIGDQKKDMHDIIIEEIRKQDLPSQSKKTIFKIKTRLFWKTFIRINQLLPIFFAEICLIARNR